MRHIKNTLTITAILALQACASPKYNYRPTESTFSIPTINQTVTINFGEPMLSQGVHTTHDALCLNGELNMTIGVKLLPGRFPKIGENETSSFYTTDLRDPKGGRVQSSALSDKSQTIQVYWAETTSEKICKLNELGGQACKKSQQGTPCKINSVSDANFQQTLIFNGSKDQTIKIGYREFSGNPARPAFNNEIEYDLNVSPIIGYKNAKIEILSATNTSITYRVIKNFTEN